MDTPEPTAEHDVEGFVFNLGEVVRQLQARSAQESMNQLQQQMQQVTSILSRTTSVPGTAGR